MSYLYILEIKPLSVASFTNIFSQSIGCLFVLFMVSFAVQKLISLIRFHLFIFVFISIALGDPTVEYYSSIKRNEVLIHATAWVNFENIMLGIPWQSNG